MNKEKTFLIFGVMILVFSGCATKTVSPIGPDEAVLIQTKAQIKNGNDTNTLKIDIALLPQKAIRLEITAILGVSVASVLLTPTEITYALHSTKQFAVGPFSEKTLYPIFRKKIDPQILWRSINNQSMADLNFKCETDAQSRPIRCLGADGTMIKWAYEAPPRKRINIKSNKFEMIWIFRDQALLNESQNETFVLKNSNNYQEIIIK